MSTNGEERLAPSPVCSRPVTSPACTTPQTSPVTIPREILSPRHGAPTPTQNANGVSKGQLAFSIASIMGSGEKSPGAPRSERGRVSSPPEVPSPAPGRAAESPVSPVKGNGKSPISGDRATRPAGRGEGKPGDQGTPGPIPTALNRLYPSQLMLQLHSTTTA